MELDEEHKGFITAEQLAKFIGATKQKNFDFTLLEILVKMQTKGLKTQVNYNDFVAWFGNSIEPTESFFFRHDSKKNPQFEINLAKTAARTADAKNMVSATIVKKDLKERFIQRCFNQYGSLKSAFVNWKVGHASHVTYERFNELVTDVWAFVVTPDQVQGLFSWLDVDNDGQISFEDLRASIGRDIAPNEGIYFRQNIVNSKNQPCNYPQCWENTLFNSKSQYCPLHQKIMKNSSLDFFRQLIVKMAREDWDQINMHLVKKKYIITLGELTDLLSQYGGVDLTQQQKVFIFETYKVKKNAEDDISAIDSRHVNVKDLVSSRATRKSKRIDDLIALE